MKAHNLKKYKINVLIILLIICNILLAQAPYGTAGKHTAVLLSEATDNPPYGFYEYLPQDFQPSSNKKYPLVLFYHGIGEQGNGNNQLSKLLVNGPPRMIENGTHFPAIVISPQSPNGWFNGDSFLSLYNYLTQHYPIDLDRIYITGLSVGGGTWKSIEAHPDKIAAIVPICGASVVADPSSFLRSKPIWAHHNFADSTVGKGNTINNVNKITKILNLKDKHFSIQKA